MNRTIQDALSQLSARQHGVFSRAQALHAGLHPSAIDRRVSTGKWDIADRAVYRVAGTPATWHQRLMAVCLAGPAVASHRSAAALWNFVDCDQRIVEVTALRHRRRRARDVVWHESGHLDRAEVTVLDGLPLTRPLRTVLDLGVVYAVERVEELVDDGLRRGWFSTTDLRRRWEQLGGALRPGGRVVRSVLDRKAAGTRPVGSILETRFRQLVRRAGLPEPLAQYEVYDGDDFVARIDFAYPQFSLAIELDGEERHAARSARQGDARRERRLVRLGFRVLRFHWDDVHKTPHDVVRDIAALLPGQPDAFMDVANRSS